MAYLAPQGPQGPCLAAVYRLSRSEPLQAVLGPWAGTQAPMPTALCLAGDNSIATGSFCITKNGIAKHLFSPVPNIFNRPHNMAKVARNP